MNTQRWTHALVAAAIAGALWLGAVHAPGPAGAQSPTASAIDPADFQTNITNPLFPISLSGPKVFEGTETDPDTGETIKTRLESQVLDRTEVVMGVTVAVLEEKAYQDGELIEDALDYIAQHRNGDVYYFGERVDNYEDGKLKDHAGQWLAGVDGAQPGVLIPASPQAGQTVRQELAPGIAEDQSTVLSLDERVSVPAGDYTGCMKTKDTTPLEPGVEEFKWFCPDVGLAREEDATGTNELVSLGASPAPAAGEDDDGDSVWTSPAVIVVIAIAAALTIAAGAFVLVRRGRASNAAHGA